MDKTLVEQTQPFCFATIFRHFIYQSTVLRIQVTGMAFIEYAITMPPGVLTIWAYSDKVMMTEVQNNQNHGIAVTCTSNRWQVTCSSNIRDCLCFISVAEFHD